MSNQSESPLWLKRTYKEKVNALVEKLTALPPNIRLCWLNASFTNLSRKIFHRCVSKDDPEAQRHLEEMKKIYWALAEETIKYTSKPNLPEDAVSPSIYIRGLIKTIKQEIAPDLINAFLDFSFDRIDLIKSQGILASLMMDREFFIVKTQPAIERVRGFYQEGVFKLFFGNASLASFDAAYLALSCGANFDQYRLYQYSRRAIIKGETTGFRSLHSELSEIREGICIVDGFCMGGKSIEESIKGFHSLTDQDLFVFISRGNSPIIPFPSNFALHQLYPNPVTDCLLPGDLAEDAIFLKVVT